MVYDVFISCTSEDKEYADAMCHYLENGNIKCWNVFRDSPLNEDSAELIPKIIADSRIMVYILSEYSHDTNDMISQINIAVSNRIDIITFRVSNINASDKVQYYIAGSHWLDAYTPPLEEKLEQLKLWIEERLNNSQLIKKVTKAKPFKYARYIKAVLCIMLLAVAVFSLTAILQPHSKTVFRKVFVNNSFIDNYYLSRDCTLYAQPHQDGTVEVINLDTGKIIQTLKTGFSSKKVDVIYCNNNKTALVSKKTDFVLFDLLTGKEINRFSLYTGQNNYDLISYGDFDSKIDFFLGNKEKNSVERIVRYDYQSDKVLMEFDIDNYFIDSYTKDMKYIVALDKTRDLVLINNNDFTKPEIHGLDALKLCNRNTGPESRLFSGDGLYYLIVKQQSTANISVIQCENGKEVFSTNFANISDIWLYKENSFVIVSQSSTERINYLTNERRQIFNDKLLKKYDMLNNKTIIRLFGYKESGCVFTILKDQKKNKEKIYVINMDANELILECDMPVQADNCYLCTYGNKILVNYISGDKYSLDYTIYNIDKSGKKHFSTQKLR